MSEAHEPDIAEVEREERKIVEETQMAGGTIHEFNPDASPQEKAAALKKVPPNRYHLPSLSLANAI